MILESKSGQIVFFVMGLVLVAIGFGGLINLNDVHLNICLSADSTFFYVLNQILICLILCVMGVCGFFMVRLSIYSFKKCREFEGEPKLHFSKKPDKTYNFLHCYFFHLSGIDYCAELFAKRFCSFQRYGRESDLRKGKNVKGSL